MDRAPRPSPHPLTSISGDLRRPAHAPKALRSLWSLGRGLCSVARLKGALDASEAPVSSRRLGSACTQPCVGAQTRHCLCGLVGSVGPRQLQKRRRNSRTHTGGPGGEFPTGQLRGLGAHETMVLAQGPVTAGHGPQSGGGSREGASPPEQTHPSRAVSRVPQARAWRSRGWVWWASPPEAQLDLCGESRARKTAAVRTVISVKRSEKPTVPGPGGLNGLWPICRKSNLQP